MIVRIMNRKQGLIYGQVWMWLQYSMENLFRHFNWLCGYFGLLLGLTPSGIMWCGRLLLCWCGLFFGPNWGFIECLQTQSYGLVEVLNIYVYHLWWVGWYCKRMTTRDITEIKSMLPHMWGWWHPWWILNVSHLGHLKVFHTTKKINLLVLIPLNII